jgi:hypothetical protein
VDTSVPTSANKVTALTYGTCGFDAISGVLNFNLPGETDANTMIQALTYASGGAGVGRPYTFLVVDPPAQQTVANAISYMQGLQGGYNTTYAAMYYPWVNASDPSAATLQATRMIPPGGMVLGQYASMDTVKGPWFAPAGSGTIIRGGVGLERALSPADLGALNLANINALKVMPNTGQVVIFGARTMMTQYSDVYVPIRRTLNYLEAQLTNLLQFALFLPNNSILWATISAAVNQFLSGVAGRNAFQGLTPKDQYYVICDATNNPPSSVAQGVVNTTVGVALNYPAEFVQLTITQFQSTGQTVAQTAVQTTSTF